MDNSIPGAIARVAESSVVGVGSKARKILKSRREIQPAADTVRRGCRQRLHAKENIVAARSPSQDEITVLGLEHRLGPGEQRVRRSYAQRQWYCQGRTSVAVEVIRRARDRLGERRGALVGRLPVQVDNAEVALPIGT